MNHDISCEPLDQYAIDFAALTKLSSEVIADAKAFRAQTLGKSAHEIYDNAYYISIVERLRLFFAKANWDELITFGDGERFVKFASTGERFLEAFLMWGTQNAVDSSSLMSIEDEIFEYLIDRFDSKEHE